jgi:nickel transport protein
MAMPLVLLVLLLAVVPDTEAHRLIVFAAAQGAEIEGRVRFAGADAAGVQVLIEDAAGGRLATLTPDADGHFRYRALAPQDHHIVARSADGHRAEWLIRAVELAAGFPSSHGAAAGASGAPQAAGASPAPPQPRHEATPPTTELPDAGDIDPRLTAAIERAVARAVAPLREELQQTRAALRLADILGGVGWILGIAGLVLWWRARGRS